jgi:hypothetical protein
MAPGRLTVLALVQAAVIGWVLSGREAAQGNGDRGPGPVPAGAGHHAALGGGPPAMLAEPLPHLAGVVLLAAHPLLLLGFLCARGLARRTVRPAGSIPVRLCFAAAAGVATAIVTPFVASFGFGLIQPSIDLLTEAVEAARYAFVLALVLTALFGMPWRPGFPEKG